LKELCMDKRIRVTVCCGTACYVLGGSDLLDLGEKLPADLRGRVDVDGEPCLGLCKDSKAGARPFAKVDGVVLAGATVSSLIDAVRSRAEALDRGALA
jgi:NADH:ubiquinone oxidoreductase subunit E